MMLDRGDGPHAREGAGAAALPAESFRRLFESAADALVLVGEDRKIQLINPYAERLLGRSAGELAGHSLSVLYDSQATAVKVARAIEMWDGEDPLVMEVRLRRGDGSAFPAELGLSACCDTAGELTGYVSVIRDITEHVEIEYALRASEERYRATFESLHDVFYQTDPSGYLTMVSPSSRLLFGYEPYELVGVSVSRLYANQSDLEALAARLDAGEVFNDLETAMVRKDGSIVAVSLNAKTVFGDDGEPCGIQGTVRDITERKRAEEERDRIFRLSVDMIAVVDQSGRFLQVNPAWTRQLGYTEHDLLGRVAWELVPEKDRPWTIERAAAARHGEEVRELTVRFRDRWGHQRYLSWTLAPMTEDGQIYAVARDVTESIKNQQQMEEMVDVLQANAAVLSEQAAELDLLRLEAEHMANHDMLTGAANRRAWFSRATETRPAAVAIFDIDLFKSVNDTYGHPAGDAVLREIALRLEESLPANALLGRIGGEEFGVLFYSDFAGARAATEAAAAAISSRPFDLPGVPPLEVTVSGGLAAWQASPVSREASLARTYEEADAALYEAKQLGRRRIVVRNPKQTAAA